MQNWEFGVDNCDLTPMPSDPNALPIPSPFEEALLCLAPDPQPLIPGVARG